MAKDALKALNQIRQLADSVLGSLKEPEDAPAEVRKALPRGAGREYVRPLINEFAPNTPFVTAEVLEKFKERYPAFKASEQTVRRALQEFATEGLLDRVGTGWKLTPKLKIQRGAA